VRAWLTGSHFLSFSLSLFSWAIRAVPRVVRYQARIIIAHVCCGVCTCASMARRSALPTDVCALTSCAAAAAAAQDSKLTPAWEAASSASCISSRDLREGGGSKRCVSGPPPR